MGLFPSWDDVFTLTDKITGLPPSDTRPFLTNLQDVEEIKTSLYGGTLLRDRFSAYFGSTPTAQQSAYFQRLIGIKEIKKSLSRLDDLGHLVTWLTRFGNNTEDTQKTISALKFFWGNESIREAVTIPPDLLIQVTNLYNHLSVAASYWTLGRLGICTSVDWNSQGSRLTHLTKDAPAFLNAAKLRLASLKAPLQNAIYQTAPETFTEADTDVLRRFSQHFSKEKCHQMLMDNATDTTHQYGAVALLMHPIQACPANKSFQTILTTWSREAVTLVLLSLNQATRRLPYLLTHINALNASQQTRLHRKFLSHAYEGDAKKLRPWPLLKTWSMLPEGEVRNKLARILHCTITVLRLNHLPDLNTLLCGDFSLEVDNEATKEPLIWQFLIDTGSIDERALAWMFIRLPGNSGTDAQKEGALERFRAAQYIPTEDMIHAFFDAITLTDADTIKWAEKAFQLGGEFLFKNTKFTLPRWIKKKVKALKQDTRLIQAAEMYSLCKAITRFWKWGDSFNDIVPRALSKHLIKECPFLQNTDWQARPSHKAFLQLELAHPFYRQVVQDLGQVQDLDPMMLWPDTVDERNQYGDLSIRCYLRLKLDIQLPSAPLLNALASLDFFDAFEHTGLRQTADQLDRLIKPLITWLEALLNKFPMPTPPSTKPPGDANKPQTAEDTAKRVTETQAATHARGDARDKRVKASEHIYTAFLTWLTPLHPLLSAKATVSCANFLYQHLLQTDTAYNYLAPLTRDDILTLTNPRDCLIAAQCIRAFYSETANTTDQTTHPKTNSELSAQLIAQGRSLTKTGQDKTEASTLTALFEAEQSGALFRGMGLSITWGKQQRLVGVTQASLNDAIVKQIPPEQLAALANKILGENTVFVTPTNTTHAKPALTITSDSRTAGSSDMPVVDDGPPTAAPPSSSSHLKRSMSDREAADTATADTTSNNTKGKYPHGGSNRHTKKLKSDMTASPTTTTEPPMPDTLLTNAATSINFGAGANTTGTDTNALADMDTLDTNDGVTPMSVETPTL